MTKRITLLCLLSALALTGCAAKNDAGIVLHKKPDLTRVTPGTPANKVASLKKPIKREVITKGDLKGAEAWLYEWDAPNDEVNNKMYTSVIVKDGVILGYAEDTPDKWSKNPELFKAAEIASSWENAMGYMAQAAQYRAAADFASGYGAAMANRSRSTPSYASQNFLAYKPWENAQPANYGMVGGSAAAPAWNNAFSSQNVYPTLPGSGGMRDVSAINPIGAAQGGKVYPTLPNSLGMRDITKTEPTGVVQDGKVYPTIPGSGGMRDITKMEPIGVVGQ